MNTKAVEASVPMLLEVLAEVVARIGLQSSRLMKEWGRDFRLDALEPEPELGRVGREVNGGAGRKKDDKCDRPIWRRRLIVEVRHYGEDTGDIVELLASDSRAGAGG